MRGSKKRDGPGILETVEEPGAAVPAEASDAAASADETRGGPRLGDLLVSQNLIDLEQLAAALERQGVDRNQRLGEILLEIGALDEPALARVLGDQHGLEVVDLR